MRVDVRAHLDLLDLDDLLVATRLGGLLLVGVFQLAEIEDLDDRRLGVGGDFDEVEAGFLSQGESIVDRYNAPVLSAVVDELNLGNPDVLVRTRPVLAGRRGLEWSANGAVSWNC
jgi:hypothetical protein